MPTGKGLYHAIRNGVAIGCTAIQVFTSSPRMWKGKPPTPAQVEALRAAVEETQLPAPLVSHDTYLVNLCAPIEETRQKSRQTLTEEMIRCGQYGIALVVSHMGAHMGQGEEAGLRIVAEEAKEVLKETPESVTLLMETTAGQGSSLNYRFEQLAQVLEWAGSPDRLAVCLDTCHIFAAGYDIRTKEGYEQVFAEFDRIVGIDKIKCLHINDSKKPLGSRVDRHEHLGDGEIGPTAFECLMQDPRFAIVPCVVETPEAETMHAENVRRLWAWAEPAR
jgi:deoxyribonuclease-4